MITEKETVEMLSEYFPELLPELEKPGVKNSIYKTLYCFIDYTKQCAYKDNTEELKRCFSVANDLIVKGNTLVVSAMTSVYIFALSGLLDGLTALHIKVKSLLTENLKNEYNRQTQANYP